MFKLKVFRFTQNIDWILIITVLALVGIGILVIYSSTYADQNPKSLALYQGIFAFCGLLIAIALALVDYRATKSYALFLYLIGLLLLVVVLILGKTVFGATRWINLGFFQLQPSEIFKLILVIFHAKFLSDNIGDLTLKKILTVIVFTAIPVILILAEPDLGTALVLVAITLGMLIAAEIRKIYLLAMGLIAILFSPLVWFLLRDYQKERLITFINPSHDPFGSGYNVLQSIIAIGSGKFSGQGLGAGSQSQLNFLPIKHADFIFAVFAEALGFLGALILLLVLFLLIIRIIRIAKIASDDFGMLIAVGIAVMFLFQILVNVGMNIGIMPVTGIPLPFISYGGTSLMINLAAVGILTSIVLRHKKIIF